MQLTETYSWDSKTYETLINCMKKGLTVGVDQHVGSFILVKKKAENNGEPYIEAVFQSYD